MKVVVGYLDTSGNNDLEVILSGELDRKMRFRFYLII
ncbi:MAG: hypothetical protein ACI9FG_001232 [Crocinitomicaceae bacterium]|jgi:hypothetical protein